MKLLLLNESLKTAFATAGKMEASYPKGEWLNFDASSGVQVLGVYLTNSQEEEEGSEFVAIHAHKDFMDHFLGLFTPSLDDQISVYNAKEFTDFCLHLNDCLNKELKIYDLSRKKLWIWHEKTEGAKSYTVPEKLKNYLQFV